MLFQGVVFFTKKVEAGGSNYLKRRTGEVRVVSDDSPADLTRYRPLNLESLAVEIHHSPDLGQVSTTLRPSRRELRTKTPTHMAQIGHDPDLYFQ